MNEQKENNTQPSTGQTGPKRDINARTVLGNPILCAQFLRDNVNIPFLKNVQPEDIEDVSEKYRPYLGTEFESDTVKRIRIHDAKRENNFHEPLFLVSLTEHKSVVDYDVAMQLLKYMLCIWLDYGKEMKKQKSGASDRKGFRYPAIIPIVYYEGKASWTADRRFRARIADGELFRNWIPDFTYEIVRLHDYSNEELLARGNEMSLIMLFNKVQDAIGLSEFLNLPREDLDGMIKDSPEAVLDIIVSVMESLCVKIDATVEETQECVSKVKERSMGNLFENMEKMSIQEERKNTAQAKADAERAKEDAEKAKVDAKKAKADAKKAKEDAKKAKADYEKAKADSKKAKADAAVIKTELERARENNIRLVIEYSQNLNLSKEQAVHDLMEKCGIDRETARQKINLYWQA